MTDGFNEEPDVFAGFDDLVAKLFAEEARDYELSDEDVQYLDRIKVIEGIIKQNLYSIPGLMDADYEKELNTTGIPGGYVEGYELMDYLSNYIASETHGRLNDSSQWNLPQKLRIADEIIEQIPSGFSIDPFMAAIDIAGGGGEPLFGMSREDVELQNILHNPTLRIDKIIRNNTMPVLRVVRLATKKMVDLHVFPGEHDIKERIVSSVALTAAVKGLCDVLRFELTQKGDITPHVEQLLNDHEANAERFQIASMHTHSAEFIDTIGNITEELRAIAMIVAAHMLKINIDGKDDTA